MEKSQAERFGEAMTELGSAAILATDAIRSFFIRLTKKRWNDDE